MRHTVLIALACVLVLGLATSASLADEDRMSLREMGFTHMESFEDEGFTMRNEIEIGLLFPGESYYFEMHMSAGVEYVIAAGGSTDVESMKLEMFDENYNMVTADVRMVPQVYVIHVPEWSGTYFFRLTMVDCPENGAHWYIIKGYK